MVDRSAVPTATNSAQNRATHNMYINFQESFQEMKKQQRIKFQGSLLSIQITIYESWELDDTYLQTKQIRDDEWEQLEAEGHLLVLAATLEPVWSKS